MAKNKISLTDAQEEAINLKDKTLLVSAAAGSGRFILRIKGDEFVAKNILSEIPEIKSSEVIGSRERGTVDIMVEARDGEDVREKVFNVFAAKNVAIIMNKPMEKTIEDIFVRVIGETEAEPETEEIAVKKSTFKKLSKKGE